MNELPTMDAVEEPIADFEVAFNREEWISIHATTIARAVVLALFGVGCWYVLWLVVPNEISFWMSLLAFPIALILGYGLSQAMMRREANSILLRRKNLLRRGRQRLDQHNVNRKEN